MAAIELVRGFRQVRALVLGDAMLDSYLEGTAARLCTEGPVPVVRKTAERRVPGGAANTAANLRALGADVIFLGIVGRDVAGTMLRSALRELDVDDRWLVEDESAETLHKLRILADGQYVVRFDEGGTHPHQRESQERLLAHLDRVFPRCDLVVVSDYGYGVASERLIERLRALRATHPTRVSPLVVDSKNLLHFRHAGATVLTPNHLEAWLAAGAGLVPAQHASAAPVAFDTGIDLAEVERIGAQLLAQVDAAGVAITLGGDGVLLCDRRGGPALHLPAHPVPHANDVGAGDSFTAALALALAAGGEMAEAARIGIDAGSIAVTKRWTSVVHHQELLQRVSLRDHAAQATQGGMHLGGTPLIGRDASHDASWRQALPALAARLDGERQAGRTIVFTNGVFDILHAGHVQFLRQAKKLGDVLVVGINSDRSARRLKGQTRPVTGELDRLALVAALDAVDHVVLFDEDTPAATIRALRPHVHVKGGDYADEDLPEAEAVREVGGCIVILPLVGSLSTSGMIDRIVALTTSSEL